MIINDNVYQSLFNKATGEIYSSLVEHVHFETNEELQATVNKIKEEALAKDNITLELYQISQEDWEYYTGNKGNGDNDTGYIMDFNTHKPMSAPPLPPPTEEEVRKQKLNELQTYYNQQENSFQEDLSVAQLSDNEPAILSIKQEFRDFQQAYKDSRAQLLSYTYALFSFPLFTRKKRCKFCKSELVNEKCPNTECINYDM